MSIQLSYFKPFSAMGGGETECFRKNIFNLAILVAIFLGTIEG